MTATLNDDEWLTQRRAQLDARKRLGYGWYTTSEVAEYVCGTTRAYRKGCRCDECRAAQRDYINGRRANRKRATHVQ